MWLLTSNMMSQMYCCQHSEKHKNGYILFAHARGITIESTYIITCSVQRECSIFFSLVMYFALLYSIIVTIKFDVSLWLYRISSGFIL